MSRKFESRKVKRINNTDNDSKLINPIILSDLKT